MRSNGINWGQIGANWTKRGQAGLNICQTEFNKVKVKLGIKVANRGKLGYILLNWVKFDKKGMPNGALQEKMRPDGVKQGQIGANRGISGLIGANQGQLGPIGANQGQSGPIRANRGQSGPIGANRGQLGLNGAKRGWLVPIHVSCHLVLVVWVLCRCQI